MSFNPSQEKNNLKAVIIGLMLIVIAILAIFFRPKFSSEKNIENQPAENKTDIKNNPADFASISIADFLKKIEKKEPIEIIDLRNPANFEKEHILNSKNLSLDDMRQSISNWDKSRQYFIVDDLGFSPAEIEIIELLKNNGFEKVSYLEGGIIQWKNEYNPLVNAGDPYSLVDQSKVSYIKSDELASAVKNSDKNIHILDLRTTAEYANGHISGAVNIPLDALEKRYGEIPKNKKTVLYGNDGLAAFQGAVRLFDIGILNVYALSDGLDAWKQKGLEIIKLNH